MSALERPLAGTVLHYRLVEQIESVRLSHADGPAGRTARTLVKDGPLRVTLTTMEAGSGIAPHAAEGPVTIQALRGRIRVTLDGSAVEIEEGELLALPPRERHAVHADEAAAFLLTVVMPGPGG